MTADPSTLFVWDVYSGPNGTMLVIAAGELPPADEGWEVHTLGVSSKEAWDLTAACRMNNYRITEDRKGAEVAIALRKAGYRAWIECECGHEILVTDANTAAIGLTMGNALVWLDLLN